MADTNPTIENYQVLPSEADSTTVLIREFGGRVLGRVTGRVEHTLHIVTVITVAWNDDLANDPAWHPVGGE